MINYLPKLEKILPFFRGSHSSVSFSSLHSGQVGRINFSMRVGGFYVPKTLFISICFCFCFCFVLFWFFVFFFKFFFTAARLYLANKAKSYPKLNWKLTVPWLISVTLRSDLLLGFKLSISCNWVKYLDFFYLSIHLIFSDLSGMYSLRSLIFLKWVL